jgi:hypothetical protein
VVGENRAFGKSLALAAAFGGLQEVGLLEFGDGLRVPELVVLLFLAFRLGSSLGERELLQQLLKVLRCGYSLGLGCFALVVVRGLAASFAGHDEAVAASGEEDWVFVRMRLEW